MLYYILAVSSAVCIALQFSVTKIYQEKNGTAVPALLFFTMLSGFISFMLFFCVNGFKLTYTPYTFFMAMAVAAVSVINGVLSVLAMSMGKVSVFTMYMLLGGMFLPFVYGLFFLNEKLTAFSVTGIILLFVSLALPAFEKKRDKRNTGFVVICVCAFVFNGLCSIISKAHQINAMSADTNSYIIFDYVFTFILSLAALLIYKLFSKDRVFEKSKSISPSKTEGKHLILLIVIIALYAVLSGGGYLMQLISAKHLAATVLYPIVTGGTVFLSGICGRLFFKEKIGAKNLTAMALAFTATVFFVI